LPVPEDDLSLLIDAALKAGAVARGFVGATAKRWDKPDNAGPVTEADLAVNDLLLSELRGARPNYGWLSEETEDNTDRLGHDKVFIIDPIDGTRAFVNGIPLFATLIALVRNGEPILGLNAYPALGERWLGIQGKPTRHWYGASESGTVRVRPCPAIDDVRLCTTSPDMFDAEDAMRYAKLKDAVRDTRFGTDAWAYAMVASGQTDMAAEAGMQPYDYLSHAVVVAGAGGTITDWEGQPLCMDSPGSVLAAGDAARHAEALALLQAG